jgi:hypothetical protein
VGTVELEPEVTAWLDGLADDEFGHVERYIDLLADQGARARRADLTTRYLGLELRTPIVASAGLLTGDADAVRRVVAAGASAVVLPSLFEEEMVHEEIELNPALEAGGRALCRGSGLLPSGDD